MMKIDANSIAFFNFKATLYAFLRICNERNGFACPLRFIQSIFLPFSVLHLGNKLFNITFYSGVHIPFQILNNFISKNQHLIPTIFAIKCVNKYLNRLRQIQF